MLITQNLTETTELQVHEKHSKMGTATTQMSEHAHVLHYKLALCMQGKIFSVECDGHNTRAYNFNTK